MKDQVGKALDALVQAVERGESEQLRAYLGMMGGFHRYSVSNVLLIAMQRPGATHVAGFRTWQKLGRQVLAHELLHRDEDEQLSRTVRETEAEAVAFVVCQAIGLEAVNAAADYIRLYQGSKETLPESLQRIRETAVAIIGAVTKKEPAEASGCGAERQGAEMGELQVARAA